jgi:outer membrane protein
MKKIFGIFIAIAFIFSSFSSVHAQKFGHLNSLQLISELPEMQTANGTLEVFQTQLESQGKVMVEKLERDYNAYMIDINNGNLSQVEIAKAESELQLQQQSLQQYEADAQQKIVNKRTELYKPILDKIKKILDEIGKDQGYTMIFDTSQGFLVHANESEDVSDLVRKKLGI